MALDVPGYEPDAIRTARADRRGSDADATARRAEPAEVRTRAECYAAARATGDQAIHADEDHGPQADRPERSGWDMIDADIRPPLDAIRNTPERSTHILDGDDYGGGHRHGTGKPGKTEFPAIWSDEKILANVLDTAQRPDSAPVYQNRNGRWLCVGTRDSVEVSVIVLCSGEVWTAWPEEGGPGVVRNPKKGTS
jgi:Bacterial EndoU nuclease